MKAYAVLVGIGVVLVGAAVLLGGPAAGIGGGAALLAQLAAVLLLRPAMAAPPPAFLGRWLGGMALRAATLGVVVVAAATHRHSFPPLPATLGFLGVLLPLLFAETRFLR